MGTPKDCKPADIEYAANKAKETGHYYAPMFVQIINTNAATNEIVFSIWGVKDPVSFTAVWGDTKLMWPACPSSLPSQATPDQAGPLPAKDSYGVLYLSDTFISTNKLDDTPKWPLRLPIDPLTTEIEVLPVSLQLTAVHVQNGTSTRATIELLDRNYSSRNQTLELSKSKMLKVRLTELGFQELEADFEPTKESVDKAVNLLAAGGATPDEAATAWKVIASAANFLARVPEDRSDSVTSLRQRLAGLMLSVR